MHLMKTQMKILQTQSRTEEDVDRRCQKGRRYHMKSRQINNSTINHHHQTTGAAAAQQHSVKHPKMNTTMPNQSLNI